MRIFITFAYILVCEQSNVDHIILWCLQGIENIFYGLLDILFVLVWDKLFNPVELLLNCISFFIVLWQMLNNIYQNKYIRDV
jgi:hypothetical protein